MTYQVLAGYVTVEMDVPGGRARRDVRAGELLPADVPDAEVRMLLERGDIVEREQPTPEPDPDEVPDGTINDVLAWVGDDLERAARALDAEQAGKDRRGIVDPLTDLLTSPE